MNVANARSCLNAGTRGTMGVGLGQAIAVAEPPAALPEPVLGRAYGPTLRGLRRPQYRLRVGEARVFYDISRSTVEILAIVTKSEAEVWLKQFGDPV